jgi:hypothetical protein
MASGNGGQVGLAKIGSLYSAVDTVNLWANFTSESIEHILDELAEASINGRRDAPNSYKGLDHGAGDLNFEPNPNALGHFFKANFGTLATSLVTAAGSLGANSGDFAGAPQQYHKFTPTQAAFSDRTFLEPYNVMVYRDIGSAWLFGGAILPNLKISIAAKQIVKATATWMSRDVRRVQRTSTIQSLVSSGGRPWLWDMGSFEVSTVGVTSAALNAFTAFENFNMNFDLPNDGIALLDGTKKFAEFVPTDFRRIKVDGTMSFRDQDTYDAFVAYEARRVRVTFLNVNSKLFLGNPTSADATKFLGYPGLRFTFPQLKFTKWSAPMGGPNRIVASFEAKAEFNEADGISAMVELMNIVTSTDYTTAY